MKTQNFSFKAAFGVTLLATLFTSLTAWSESTAFVRESQFPISWVKQPTSHSWNFIKGVTGVHKVRVDLVKIEEEVTGRKLASTDTPQLQYKLVTVKKNVKNISQEEANSNQVLLVIEAP